MTTNSLWKFILAYGTRGMAGGKMMTSWQEGGTWHHGRWEGYDVMAGGRDMAASSGHGSKSRKLRDHILNCKCKTERWKELHSLKLPPAKSAPHPQMLSPTEDQVSNTGHAVSGGIISHANFFRAAACLSQSFKWRREKKKKDQS